jgi:HPt (histidine-containing phosphotransfer) domain-containing protein
MKLPEDPFILELLPEFIDDWIRQLTEEYDPLIASEDWHNIYRVGHTLKGSCYQFSLDEIAVKGVELMDYTKTKNLEACKAMKDTVLAMFYDVKAFLDSHAIS